MTFRTVIGDQGIFYALATTGELLWYRDVARNGSNGPTASTGWEVHSGNQIGIGWQGFSHVFSGGDGIIYAVKPSGELLWYRDLARNGSNGPTASTGWEVHSGSQIGIGWNSFSHVFSGGDGIIYAIRPTGELLWYKDIARNGTNGPNAATGWDANSGNQIGTGWNDFSHVFSGGGGIIYAVKPSGELLWYKDVARNGSNGPAAANGWDARSGSQIGSGWNAFSLVIGGGDGIIYAINQDGALLFYRDEARDGTSRWSNGGAGQPIGSGWFLQRRQTQTLEGYCKPLSVAPGSRVQFKVSARGDYTVTYMRLKKQPGGADGIVMGAPVPRTRGLQDVPAQPWKNGCGWANSFALDVPADWPSGLYSARCAAGDGSAIDIVFVVTPPPATRAKLAILANTNTWNAYNDWGGRSKYSAPPGATLSFERPSNATSPVDDGQINHLTRAELWVQNWLEDNDYKPDVFSDLDFHKGITGLKDYKALILSTHPEYWTEQMFARLKAYVKGGGCVLYLGGNGIFERVSFTEQNRKLVLLNGDETSNRAASYFRNLSPPNPERALLGVAYRYDAYMTFAPFEVLKPGHRFFAGTGLGMGDLIGQNGINGGGASGWEMDTSIPGNVPPGSIVSADGADDRGAPPAGIELLARGTNPGMGADMTCYETGVNGGFVFAAGSISFGGSLIGDSALQKIVRNALEAALNR